MQSPTDPTDPPPLPPLPPPLDEIQDFNSPSDTISHLSQSLGSARSVFSSPLKPIDIGVPKTPEQRNVIPVNEDAYEDGYDSDGLPPPWSEDHSALFDEREANEASLPVGPVPNTPRVNQDENVAENIITEAEIEKMVVNELKEELKKRGLPVRGKKEELIIRLKEALRNNLPLVGNLSKEKVANMAGETFTPGAHWVELECTGDFVVDETPAGFRAPTVPDGEVPTVQKRQYSQRFDRMAFTGIAEVPQRQRDGRIKKRKNGQVCYEKKVYTETTASMAFIREHSLNLDSHPAEWFAAFVPIKNTTRNQVFSIENCLAWTNMKAMMENAGSLGGKYKDFENFTLPELMRHIGLYLVQALSPSPQVEMKFNSQKDDPVNGNDLSHSSFGSVTWKSEKRHRHFKCFFSSQNPTIPPPSRETHPNWKVHPLLKHMVEISKKAVHLGRDLSCDEQTVGFQGNHKDKQRITYKREGDGFLADCICSDGYTYTFQFRHQEASKKIMKDFSCSPLNARVLAGIAQLPDKYYTLGMDNLFNSAKLCRAAYSMPQKVMVHGVTRPTLRGIPPIVKQNEVTKKSELESVRHTVKAAKVCGDEVCNNLLAISVYDTKPVYFLTNVAESIEWIKKSRKCFDPTKNETIDLPFHRLNIIDFYNYNMGNVDLADQLRNHYRYDSAWHRNRKWWWAIWWWGFQVLLTNSYVVYLKFHKLHDSRNTVSHYNYIKQIALAWINQELYWPKREVKKRKKEYEGTGTRSRRRMEVESLASSSSMKCTKIDDKSLHPARGKLALRLTTTVQHFPETPKAKKPKCQLHRWARGRDEGRNVMAGVITCSVCNVNLCIPCYNIFHKEANLTDKRKEIAES